MVFCHLFNLLNKSDGKKKYQKMNVTFLIVYLQISNGLLRSLDLLIFSDLILFDLSLIVTINQLLSYDIY